MDFQGAKSKAGSKQQPQQGMIRVCPTAKWCGDNVTQLRPIQKVKSRLRSKAEREVKPDSQASGLGEGANN